MPDDQRLVDYSEQYVAESEAGELLYWASPEAAAFMIRVRSETIREALPKTYILPGGIIHPKP